MILRFKAMVSEGVTSDPYYFKYQVTTLFARKHYPIYLAFEAATEAELRLLAPSIRHSNRYLEPIINSL